MPYQPGITNTQAQSISSGNQQAVSAIMQILGAYLGEKQSSPQDTDWTKYVGAEAVGAPGGTQYNPFTNQSYAPGYAPPGSTRELLTSSGGYNPYTPPSQPQNSY